VAGQRERACVCVTETEAETETEADTETETETEAERQAEEARLIRAEGIENFIGPLKALELALTNVAIVFVKFQRLNEIAVL